MKKILLVTFASAIIALAFSNVLLAQESKTNQNDKTSKKYSIGFKVGYNLVNSNNNFSLSEIESINEMSHGGYFSTSLNSHFSIQLEVLYIKKGWKETITIVDDGGFVLGTANGKMELPYIEAPILIKYSTKSISNLNFYIAPTIGYILEAEYSSSGYWNDYSVDTKYWFNNYSFGLGLGLDYMFNVKNQQITIDVRYTEGLSDIYKSETFSLKNKVFSFYVGYGI